MRRRTLLFFAPVVVMVFLLFVALGGEVVRQLWNWLLPSIFGLREITFWQALGILALCRILFGGFGLHGSGRSSVRRRWAERWEHMSPEERERFRLGIRTRCGFGPSPGTSPPE